MANFLTSTSNWLLSNHTHLKITANQQRELRQRWLKKKNQKSNTTNPKTKKIKMAAVFKTHSLTNMVVSNCYRQHWAIREMVVGSNPGCFHCWLTSRHVTHLEVREIQISYRTSHAGRENLHHQLLLGGVSAFTWLETSDHVTVCAVCCQQDSRFLWLWPINDAWF